MEITPRHALSRFRLHWGRRLHDFWSWWSSELLGMLPGRLRALVGTGRQQLFLEIRGTDVAVSRGTRTESGAAEQRVYPLNGGEPPSLPTGIGQVVLLLPREKVLAKPVSLPLAAEENLREVLSFEMDRLTPFSADQVYFDHTAPARDPKKHTLTMDLLVAPRQTLDEPLAALARIGLHPDIVTTRGDNARPLAVNLLFAQARRRRPVSVRRLNFLLAALALVLLTTAAVLPLLYKSHMINALEPLLDAASARAVAAQRLSEEIEHLLANSQFLVEKKHTTPMLLHTLNELTRTLPDDTWLERLEVNGLEVQLIGVSGSAAALIPLLESAPFFQNARFRSPVTRAPLANEERFHISAQISQEMLQ